MHDDGLFSFDLIDSRVFVKIYTRDFKPSSHQYIAKDEIEIGEVYNNHEIIKQDLSVDYLCVSNQVHGNSVVLLTNPWQINQEPECDGIVTQQKNIALGVLTADCVPVLICSGDGEFIASLHCGWRSLYQGIIENSILQLRALGALSLKAIIGPSIGYQDYIIDRNYYENWVSKSDNFTQFFSPLEENSGKYNCDLASIAKYFLETNNVEIAYHNRQSTYSNPARYPSYRYAIDNNLKKYKGSILSTITKR
ncbi:MAG: polyphenol oxidase family protein [Rickettsiaceae bacterium]|nr:polyphenol oxidase family protein [Rickettsiaceae bacterium]